MLWIIFKESFSNSVDGLDFPFVDHGFNPIFSSNPLGNILGRQNSRNDLASGLDPSLICRGVVTREDSLRARLCHDESLISPKLNFNSNYLPLDTPTPFNCDAPSSLLDG